MKRTGNFAKLCALILLLSTVISCFVACGTGGTDYVSKLTLDMTTDSLKQEVTVYKNIDGDTTHFKFKDPSKLPEAAKEDGYFKARYMAINTPESTGKIEEWGKKASTYTKEALAKVAYDVAYFAEKEGLSAHARSATIRFEE